MDEEVEKPVRRRIVEESFEPGVSVAPLARAHDVNANQIFHWRKLYREGLLADDGNEPAAQWLPVRLADDRLGSCARPQARRLLA